MEKLEYFFKMYKTLPALLIIFTFMTAVMSCRNLKHNQAKIPVAKAGDKVLYLDQIPEIFRNNSSKEDSIAAINNYINSWARKEIMFHKALENLSDENKNEIEEQLQDTKVNLYIYHYQRQMILEKMDTIVTENEIENYYADNQNLFRLNSSIVKALYIKVPSGTPGIDKVRKWYISNKPEDIRQLEEYCFNFADKYDDFGENWISFDKLAVELPEEIINPEEFLRRYSFYETHDSSAYYFITIRDYMLKSSTAPYEYVKNDIKNIILNNRRVEFLKNLENGIYEEAVKTNYFRKYN
ncbi:MAG: hypothetical protein KBG40_08840 [Bacteroidales bacterium]|nr:hypothetical protein [Bacteroidales bacterium]